MNIPNLISIFRLVAIPIFVLFLAYGRPREALVTFIVAGLSDALDGFLARVLNQKTDLGTFLDPMADKLLAGTAFIAAAIFHLMPVWLVIIVVSRDVILSLGGLITFIITGGLEITPLPLGKVSTFCQFTTIAVALASPWLSIPHHALEAAFVITALMTVISGAQYVREGLRLVGNEG